MPTDGFFGDLHESLLARVADTVYPSFWQLNARVAPRDAPSITQFWYQHLSMITYILSNKQTWWDEGLKLFSMLGMVLEQLPPSAITTIFRGHSISIRAVWDNFGSDMLPELLKDLAGKGRDEFDLNAISRIINIVLSIHPDWVEGFDDRLLILTAMVGKVELMRCVLSRRYRSPSHFQSFTCSAIVGAAIAGADDCVELLVNNCDINAIGANITWFRFNIGQPCLITSEFVVFLNYLWGLPLSRRTPNLNASLQLLISSGADVDAIYPLELCMMDMACTPEVFLAGVPKIWHPTCLDVAFYLSQHNFFQMQAFSSRRTETLSRSGVCTAALRGRDALDDYIFSQHSVSLLSKQQFIEIVLLEQFMIRRNHRNANLNSESAKVARTLLDYGIEIGQFMSGVDISLNLLKVWTRSLDEYGLTEDLEHILIGLSQLQLNISAESVKDCVGSDGIEGLAMLEKYNILSREVIRLLGAPALVQAAVYKNSRAVVWLVHMGADVNAELDYGWGKHLTVISHCLEASLFDMCRLLISSGAKLRKNASDTTCYRLLRRVLQSYLQRPTDVIQFFQSFQEELEKITRTEWNHLFRHILWRYHFDEASWGILDHLFRQYLSIEDGPILSLAIHASLPLDLVQSLVDQGADLNEMDPDLGSPICVAIARGQLKWVRKLIEAGVDPNPTVGCWWGSALTNACSLNVLCPGEKSEKMNLIRYLIQHGADINCGGEPYKRLAGYIPLQACAIKGDVETASLLLQHGADPNTLCYGWSGRDTFVTALDLAAGLGRIDMIQLLLKAGGLSHMPGSTGYDRLIASSSLERQPAVVKLIREHILFNERGFKENPGFRCRHQSMINQVERRVMMLRQLAIEEIETKGREKEITS
jgi:ankyrin repeat protein